MLLLVEWELCELLVGLVVGHGGCGGILLEGVLHGLHVLVVVHHLLVILRAGSGLYRGVVE